MNDLVYVLHAMDDKTIGKADAPSPGAWALLTLARNRKGFDVEFIKSFVKPMYERMAREEEKKKSRFDDGRDLSSFIAKVRAARVRAIREGDEDATRALNIQVVKVKSEEVGIGLVDPSLISGVDANLREALDAQTGRM